MATKVKPSSSQYYVKANITFELNAVSEKSIGYFLKIAWKIMM